jgi:HTH-type transcriptional regulator/antitoxin HigA
MTIKPIKTESDYDEAVKEIGRLIDARPGTEEFDRLDVLATLVQAYERDVHPIGPPDPIDAIRFQMEKRGLSRRDLEPILGPSSRVSDILGRKRRLTTSMMRRLHDRLGIAGDVLLSEYPLKTH